MSGTTYLEAVAAALAQAMRADERVVVLGEEVATGGRTGATAGLAEAFGTGRVLEAPGGAAACGAAIGAARAGLRPVLELAAPEAVGPALDLLAHAAAAAHLRSGGQVRVPLVVRVPADGLAPGGPGLEAWLALVPGLKVVLPASPHDVAALLPSALADPGPVVVIESPALYGLEEALAPVVAPEPLGLARVRRPGVDVTIVALSRLVPPALAAAERLAERGIDAEVIDPRTLVPLDLDTLVGSAARTGRLVVAHDGAGPGGAGSGIVARVQELAFYDLDAPIARVAPPFTPPSGGVGAEEPGGPEATAIAAAAERALR